MIQHIRYNPCDTTHMLICWDWTILCVQENKDFHDWRKSKDAKTDELGAKLAKTEASRVKAGKALAEQAAEAG